MDRTELKSALTAIVDSLVDQKSLMGLYTEFIRRNVTGDPQTSSSCPIANYVRSEMDRVYGVDIDVYVDLVNIRVYDDVLNYNNPLMAIVNTPDLLRKWILMFDSHAQQGFFKRVYAA